MATATADKQNVRKKHVNRQNKERSRTGSAKRKGNPMRDPSRHKSTQRVSGEELRKRQSSQVLTRRRSKKVSAVPSQVRQSPKPVEVVQRADSSTLITLPKFFLLCGYLVGVMLVLICALDLLIGVPFSRASMLFDVGFLISGVILLYLSWDARDGCR